MKALFVLRAIVETAGIERVMSDKMNFLATHGHEVILVTYQQGCHPLAYSLHPGIRHIDLNCRYFTLYRYPQPLRLFKMWQMKRLFRRRFHQLTTELQPDIIVTVSNIGEYMSEIMSAPYGCKIFEAHCAFQAMMMPASRWDRFRQRRLLRAICRADVVITLTKSDVSYWQPYVDSVITVPNPVTIYCPSAASTDTPDAPSLVATPSADSRADRHRHRIVAVGRLEQQKRFDRLIDAFARIAGRHPDWFIDIYGSGNLETVLRQQIDSLGLTGRVNLKGHSNDIYSEYRHCQFLVLSSDYEGFGLVIVEAMACATPVVSVDCPYGPAEIISNGSDGLLCRPDAADLADKMEWMISHDDERHQMGLAAHRAAARYSPATVLPLWEAAYLKYTRSFRK